MLTQIPVSPGRRSRLSLSNLGARTKGCAEAAWVGRGGAAPPGVGGHPKGTGRGPLTLCPGCFTLVSGCPSAREGWSHRGPRAASVPGLGRLTPSGGGGQELQADVLLCSSREVVELARRVLRLLRQMTWILIKVCHSSWARNSASLHLSLHVCEMEPVTREDESL